MNYFMTCDQRFDHRHILARVPSWKKRKVRVKRYEARSRGRSSPDSLAFSSLRNARTIEPTTAWTAVPSSSASTTYSFLHLNGVRRALWANSCEGSAQ